MVQMVQKKYWERLLVSLGLILIFTSSATKSMFDYYFLTQYLFIIGGLLILGVVMNILVKRDIYLSTSFKIFTSIYGLFMFVVVISSLYSTNLYKEYDSIEKLFLMYLFLGVGLTLTEVVSKGMLIRSLVVSSLLVFGFFLIEYPISDIGSEAYRGGFNNENSIGVLGATLFSISLVAGVSLIRNKKRYLLAIIYLLIAVGASYLVLISNSRTSFVTLAIVFGIIASIILYEELKKREMLSLKNILITLLIFVVGLILFVFINNPVYALLESTILDKFARQMESGSLITFRFEIWTEIVKGAHLLDNEKGYLMDVVDIGAHNSFLHILSHYSWIAAIIYTLFWIGLLVKSVNYYLKNKSTHVYALFPFIAVINFILISMMENMTGHVSAMLPMALIAVFSEKTQKRSTRSSKYTRVSRMEKLHS